MTTSLFRILFLCCLVVGRPRYYALDNADAEGLCDTMPSGELVNVCGESTTSTQLIITNHATSAMQPAGFWLGHGIKLRCIAAGLLTPLDLMASWPSDYMVGILKYRII